MRIKVARGMYGRLADAVQYMVFQKLREDKDLSMPWLCGMCDIYGDIAKKAEKYTQDDTGYVTFGVPDNAKDYFTDMLEHYAVDEIRRSVVNDMEWVSEVVNIYRQLKRTSEGGDEPGLDINLDAMDIATEAANLDETGQVANDKGNAELQQNAPEQDDFEMGR